MVLNQPAGQIVQQLRVAGAFAKLTEIAGGAHEADPKMMLPDTIRHHSRRERIFGAGNGLSQFQPSAASRKGSLFSVTQDGQKTPRSFLAQVFAVATNMDADIRGFSRIFDCM